MGGDLVLAFSRSEFEHLTPSTVDVSLNKGAKSTCRLAVPHMQEKPGNLSSLFARRIMRLNSVPTLAKAKVR